MENKQELQDTTNTLQATNVPVEIWYMVLESSTKGSRMHVLLAMMSMVCKEFNQLVRYYKACSKFFPHEYGLRGAILSSGHLELLSTWMNLGVGITKKDERTAVQGGYLDCFQYVWSKWKNSEENSNSVERKLQEVSLMQSSIVLKRKEICEFLARNIDFIEEYVYCATAFGSVECMAFMFDMALEKLIPLDFERIRFSYGADSARGEAVQKLQEEYLKKFNTPEHQARIMMLHIQNYEKALQKTAQK